MIPHLCPELPAEQKEALKYGVKVPLVYTSVALKNWTAFKKLGINGANSPGMYHTGVRLEMPTVIGGYNPTPKSPDDPILVRMTRTPCKPGLPSREQHRAGHVDLLSTPFATFERNIRDQLARILSGGGFDPGARHRRHHRQPLAARLRLRIQPAVGSGLDRRGSRRARSAASRSAGSRSPILTPPPRPTPTSAMDQAYRAVERVDCGQGDVAGVETRTPGLTP